MCYEALIKPCTSPCCKRATQSRALHASLLTSYIVKISAKNPERKEEGRGQVEEGRGCAYTLLTSHGKPSSTLTEITAVPYPGTTTTFFYIDPGTTTTFFYIDPGTTTTFFYIDRCTTTTFFYIDRCTLPRYNYYQSINFFFTNFFSIFFKKNFLKKMSVFF